MAKPEPKLVDTADVAHVAIDPATTNPVIENFALDPAAMPEPAPALDGMSVADLRLPQNFAESAGVKKLLTTVPVRKPNKQDFNRVHRDPTFRSVVGLIELKDDRDIYLVSPAMVQELPGEYYPATLYTTINRQGVIFLWPVRLPEKDGGKQLEWHRSAAEHALKAMEHWARITANMSLGAYEITLSTKIKDEPVWPENITFQKLLEIAFRDCFINRIDHPVVQRLRGLV
jgi:hypothetical protein